jgi:nucleoid DNA-binding protein
MNDNASGREIIELLVKHSGITKKLAAEILHVIPDIIEEGLKKDGEVRVKGLGTFRLKWVRGRMGRNPKTGKRVEIPSHNRVIFLPERSIKEYINRDYRLLGYKIIPSAEKVTLVDEIIPEHEPLPQSTNPEPEPLPKYHQQTQFEPGPEQPTGKRRVHWIVPVAVSVIIVLSLIFFFRNCYHISQQSEVSSHQSVVDNQRPVPTAEPEGTASDSNSQFPVSRQRSAVG